MSILVNKDSKVVIQGITGSEGQFHGDQMLDYGTNIFSGVTPGKGGMKTLDERVPVFNSFFNHFFTKSIFKFVMFINKSNSFFERLFGLRYESKKWVHMP